MVDNKTGMIGRLVGMKEIVLYLRPYLGLANDLKQAWKMVKRWQMNYGLCVRQMPNNHPYIDKEEFEVYWAIYEQKMQERRNMRK